MLDTNKTININATSSIKGQMVVYMYATLNTEGSNTESISKNIQNQELYNANKDEVRKDMRDFEDLVYAEQDKLVKTIESTNGGN